MNKNPDNVFMSSEERPEVKMLCFNTSQMEQLTACCFTGLFIIMENTGSSCFPGFHNSMKLCMNCLVQIAAIKALIAIARV